MRRFVATLFTSFRLKDPGLNTFRNYKVSKQFVNTHPLYLQNFEHQLYRNALTAKNEKNPCPPVFDCLIMHCWTFRSTNDNFFYAAERPWRNHRNYYGIKFWCVASKQHRLFRCDQSQHFVRFNICFNCNCSGRRNISANKRYFIQPNCLLS